MCSTWEATQTPVDGPILMHIYAALSKFRELIKEHVKLGRNSGGEDTRVYFREGDGIVGLIKVHILDGILLSWSSKGCGQADIAAPI